MTYRDDLEAAGERARALERDLQRAKAENERLRKELEEAKHPPEPPAPEATPPPKPQADGAPADLAAAAARGRAIREDAERKARKLRTDAEVERLRKAEKAYPLSLTPWGYFPTTHFLVGFPAAVCAVLLIVLVQTSGTFPPLFAFLVPPIVAALLFALSRPRVKGAVEREDVWLAELPFKVVGYGLLFTGSGYMLKTLVTFKHKQPQETLVRDALLVLDPEASVSGSETQWHLRVPLRHHKGTPFTVNRRANLRFHELVELLKKIHTEYPIDRVHPELD